MRQRKTHFPIKRLAALCLVLLLAASLLPPLAAHAQGGEKVVRVGWHEEPYFITDQYGRRSGYSYEYQCKVAAYTGWTYEYVEGSWTELLQKLKDGELDLLSDVSFMEERAQDMLYASLPMGTEAYYIFVAPPAATASSPVGVSGKKAVAAGGADCVIISNYRYNNISKLGDRYGPPRGQDHVRGQAREKKEGLNPHFLLPGRARYDKVESGRAEADVTEQP